MAYANRKVVTIKHALVGGSNLTDFRVLFSGIYAYLATLANGGQVTSSVGDDIIFTAANGITLLDFERVSYDPVTGKVEFWIKTSVSASVDTVINLFFGDASVVSYQGTTNTWSSYAAVYHLADGTTLSLNDSTANANNAAPHGPPPAVAGQIDGGAHFATLNTDYAQATDAASLHLATPFTISFWINLDSHAGTDQFVCFRSSGSNLNYAVQFNGTTGKTVFFYRNGSNVFMTDTTVVVPGAWTHVAVVVITGTTPVADFYINGAHSSTQNAFLSLPSVGAGDLFIGGANAFNETLFGVLDELHLIPVGLPAGWFVAEYNNQLSPATFYTITGASTYSESATCTLQIAAASAGAMGYGPSAVCTLALGVASGPTLGYASGSGSCPIAMDADSQGTEGYNSPGATDTLVIRGAAITSIGTVPLTCLTGDGMGAAVIPPGVDPGWAY